MKRTLLALFLLLAMAGRSPAQYDLKISGYVIDLPIFQMMRNELAQINDIGKNQFLNLTRLRLNPNVSLWADASINLEYEITSVYSSEKLQLNEIPDKTNRQIFDARWYPVVESHYHVAHFIDRLYFRQNFSFGNLVIGRQRISWGTGRVWNPTDLFNPINPASYDKIEKDGADAISTKIYTGSFTDLSLVYNPQNRLDSSNAGFRFRTNYGEYDLSVMGGYFDRRYIAGGDFAGNLFESGFRGEGIFSINKDDCSDRFIRFILGLDYQFTPELYAMIEYQFNGEGAKKKSEYDIARLFKAEILNVARNYLFVSAMYQVHPLVTTLVGVNANLDDGSGFISCALSWSALENFVLNLGGLITYGGLLDEYWYYPTAVYAKVEFYF